MRYFGGKARVASHLVDPIHALLKTWYFARFVDLFCGSMNVISRVEWPHKWANDANPYIIATYRHAISGGDFPETITEEEYADIRDNKDNYPDWLVGFVGFGCSFAGKFFGGYARCSTGRNYAAVAGRGVMKKASGLQGDLITTIGDYHEPDLLGTDLVYCDIPYEGTTGYSVGDFDHNAFYQWIDNQPFTVLVSEYEHNARGSIIWKKAARKDIRNSEGQREKTTEILQAFNLPPGISF